MIAWINLCFYMLEKLISLVYGVQLCAGIYYDSIYFHIAYWWNPAFSSISASFLRPVFFHINLLNYCFSGVFLCKYFGRTFAVT